MTKFKVGQIVHWRFKKEDGGIIIGPPSLAYIKEGYRVYWFSEGGRCGNIREEYLVVVPS